MSLQVLQPGPAPALPPVSRFSTKMIFDWANAVLYYGILGIGLLTPLVFYLYAVLLR